MSKNQIFVGCGRRLMPACHAIAFSLAKLRKAKSVKFIGVWIDSFICMDGTGRVGDKCACGNSHTIGKCERAQRQTAGRYCEGGSKSVSRSWNTGEGFQQTDGEFVKPLGLPEETVHLVHLVYPSFRPTFFGNHRVDFLT